MEIVELKQSCSMLLNAMGQIDTETQLTQPVKFEYELQLRSVCEDENQLLHRQDFEKQNDSCNSYIR